MSNDSVTAPMVSPFTWAAHIIEGRLVLSGYVPNDAARAELMAAAKVEPPARRRRRPDGARRRRPAGLGLAAAASVRELAGWRAAARR